ncbi:MAG TPA: beta-propeller fold lactonase family protein [Bryobacteraceae bacterium]|nr:beta-propeller fold lactonase family protein [Bryobacteraceae bacterium]
MPLALRDFGWLPAVCVVALCLGGCSKTAPVETEKQNIPAAGPRIYVSDEVSGGISIIDASTFTVNTIHLGKRARGIHASPDNKKIYIALSGSPIGGPNVDESKLPPPDKSADAIAEFDVATQKVSRMLQAGSDPENFAVSQDGRTIFVSNEDDDGVSFLDIASGKLTKTIKTGEEPEGVTVSPDGRLIYSTNEADGTVTVIDIAAEKLISTIKVGRRPRNVVFTPDGKHAWVNAENDGTICYLDTVKNSLIQTILLGKPGEIKPMGMALSPDASKLYVSTGRGKMVFVIDTATNKPVTSFEVGQRPWGIAVSADGRTLYSANGPSNDVSVVDLGTNTVLRKVPVGQGPWGLIVLNP